MRLLRRREQSSDIPRPSTTLVVKRLDIIYRSKLSSNQVSPQLEILPSFRNSSKLSELRIRRPAEK